MPPLRHGNMTDDSITISRAHRPDIKAFKQDDGSVIIRAGRAWLHMDADDLHQLYAYAADRPRIQRYAATK